MKNLNFYKKIGNKITVITVLVSLLNVTGLAVWPSNQVSAAVNLIKEGSFEGNIDAYWGIWKAPASTRTYEFYRAYDAPFGFGSYSAAIDAKGAPEGPFNAVLSGNETLGKFAVQAEKNYYLIFYARATKNTDIIPYLQNAETHSAISAYQARTIGEKWEKYVVSLTSNATGNALLAVVFGSMPDGASLYLDGIQLLEADFGVTAKEVKGYINDEKFITMKNILPYSLSDFQIELPYYDNLTGKATVKKFSPTKMTGTGVYFKMPERTYSGLGNVYINNIYAGSFDYNVSLKLDSYHPGLVRIGEDMVVYGSGFMPKEKSSTYLVVNALNAQRQTYQNWIAPETVDSNLRQLSFKLPAGTISGTMYVQTSFMDSAGKERLNKSNSLAYKLKPVIVSTDWSRRGYEHVGDKLKISGKGLGLAPSVVYYDSAGTKLETIKATVVAIGELETIEVVTTKKANSFDITVLSEGVESDRSSYLSYLAKPKINSIQTKYSRTISAGTDKIMAAKVGDEITITGEGFKAASSSVSVEFQGHMKRIAVAVPAEKISLSFTSLKVAVPSGAQNGYLNVEVNGKDSNYVALEIVPTVVSVTPDPAVSGQDIVIVAEGVGDNLNLASVSFQANGTELASVQPHAIDLSGDRASIYVTVPMQTANAGTKAVLQYDRWSDNGTAVLNVRPYISGADINLDTRILSIKGYGFSINGKENIITYKYADQAKTVVKPNVRLLGVYPTEEGLEIRLQMLDDYHYGFVSVKVGEYSSNEANFGPTSVHKIARRTEYVASEGQVMGVLYISGYNFGTAGKVFAGSHQATEHYRSEFMIIAVIDKQYVNDNPVVVTRE